MSNSSPVPITPPNLWLNYHHLAYFREIAQRGTIQSAAKKLRVTPSALSTQLRQLESALNVTLFERKKQRLHLTETGQVALKYANDIFRLGSEMLEGIRNRRTPGRLHVQIGALDNVPKHLLLDITKAALEIGPCIVSIIEGSDKDLLRELEQHRLDLIVTTHAPVPDLNNRTYSRRIGRSPLLICGDRSFISLRSEFPKSLKGVPFIFPTHDQSQMRTAIEAYFARTRTEPDVIVETQDLSVQKLLATQGLGLVALPEIAARDLLKQGTLFEIGRPENIYEDLYLVSATRRIENPISSQLFKSFRLERIRSELAKIHPRKRDSAPKGKSLK